MPIAGLQVWQLAGVETCTAACCRKARRMKRSPRYVKLLLRLVNVRQLFKPGKHPGDRFANLSRVRDFTPIDWRRVAEHSLGQQRNDLNFTFRSLVTSRSSFAQTHVVEHRLLRGWLRLFIAREHRQDDCLFSQTMRVPSVERRA